MFIFSSFVSNFIFVTIESIAQSRAGAFSPKVKAYSNNNLEMMKWEKFEKIKSPSRFKRHPPQHKFVSDSQRLGKPLTDIFIATANGYKLILTTRKDMRETIRRAVSRQ